MTPTTVATASGGHGPEHASALDEQTRRDIDEIADLILDRWRCSERPTAVHAR